MPLSREEHRRYDRLLKATRKVAPWVNFTAGRFDSYRYLDTMLVVREYNRGNPLVVTAWEAINRLAIGGYGRRRKRH